MNFWYLPEGTEDEKSLENTDMTEGRNENMKDERVDDGRESNKKEIKERESGENPQENTTLFNKTTPAPYNAGELIGLSRDIEAMVEEALGDATKVNNLRYAAHYMFYQM